MTLQENKSVVRRFYEEVHGGNLDVLGELVDADCYVHAWRSDNRVTLSEARQGLLSQRTSFPDWKIEVHKLVAEGDIVASDLTITGTHLGHFRQHAPTGKQVRFSGTIMDRVVDGKIVEMWHRPDFLRMLIQIGAVPDDMMGA
ncbi:MAG: ester cyclase [SAR202 cluster bacterium]|nr:ester cyclase [SAR202 cluster bacterium]MQG68101.1 ester cyclase [SAR202 cluster bacterium]